MNLKYEYSAKYKVISFVRQDCPTASPVRVKLKSELNKGQTIYAVLTLDGLVWLFECYLFTNITLAVERPAKFHEKSLTPLKSVQNVCNLKEGLQQSEREFIFGVDVYKEKE